MARHNINFENILDEAAKQIRNGENISAVVSEYPEDVREQLSAMLQIVETLSTIPIKNIPVPSRRRLFLQTPKQIAVTERMLNLFNSYRSAFPITIAVLLFAVTGTAYASMDSLPGSPLFAVRKAIETTQIKLASGPEQKAKLELKFANARLEDVQKVIAQSPDDANHDLVIKELQKQTVTALNNLKEVASSASVANDPEVMKKVENLTDNQIALISEKDSSKQKSLVADIKQIVAISNEQSMATLSAAESFEFTGSLIFISLKNNYIKIDNNTFEITEETKMVDKDGNKLTLAELGINDNITIKGQIKEDKNIATELTVNNRAKAIEQKVEPKPVIQKSVAQPVIVEEPPIAEPEVPSDQDTFGGVIIEPPPAL